MGNQDEGFGLGGMFSQFKMTKYSSRLPERGRFDFELDLFAALHPFPW